MESTGNKKSSDFKSRPNTNSRNMCDIVLNEPRPPLDSSTSDPSSMDPSRTSMATMMTTPLLTLFDKGSAPNATEVGSSTSRWRVMLSPAPAPAKRMAGGMGKLWELAPLGDFCFCQYVSPLVAHKSGCCDCMSSPSPFSPTR